MKSSKMPAAAGKHAPSGKDHALKKKIAKDTEHRFETNKFAKSYKNHNEAREVKRSFNAK